MAMRLAWYAGASTALAAGVVLSAFQQRANFYSAMVYLFQSNLCMMILINLIILVYSFLVYSLQRICFGELRAIEVEQLYERAWFAVTETCLAMTIFRDEIGGFFVVMFVALITGKVWGWIGEGRIEALEQQPPANPRLFHTRLIISLFLSLAYDASLLYYAVSTVIDQARPDMMVMFLFEFAVLLVTSLHTALRYAIILLDTSIIKKQTHERVEERRRQVRADREEILSRRAAGEPDDGEPLPDEDDIDEMDVEVPGWEAKGQYVLVLDLWTDFTKLCIYAVFFFVLLSFYGLPLHIIRDLFMTVRSFVKRLGALMKYRQAIRDMNKYADATEEDLARENTCIICREDMHVFDPNDPAHIERTRPKKLPCGHILHLGCLKSWMERQQVCPTCRRSVVLNDAPPPNADAAIFRIGLNMRGGGAPPPHPGALGAAAPGPNAAQNAPFQPMNAQFPAAGAGPGADANIQNNQNPGQPAANNGGVRMFQFGPFRLGVAREGIRDMQDLAQRMAAPAGLGEPAVHINDNLPPQQAGLAAQAGPNHNPMAPLHGLAAGLPQPFPYHLPAGPALHGLSAAHLFPAPALSPEAILTDLQAIERRIEQGILQLQVANEENRALRSLVLEFQRIRREHASVSATPAQAPAASAAAAPEAPESPEAPAAPQAEQADAGAAQDSATSTGGVAAQPVPQTAAQAAPAASTPAASAPPQPQVVFQQTQTFGQPTTSTYTFTRVHQVPAGFAPPYAYPPTMPASAVHLTTDRNSPAIPSGSADLPPGVQIPAGWSLLPLQRLDGGPLGPLSTSTNSDVPGGTPSDAPSDAPAGSEQPATDTPGQGATPGAPPTWGGAAQIFGGARRLEQPGAEEGEPTQPPAEQNTEA